MMTVEVFDDYLDELYHTRDLAYDNEDYDMVRTINVELSEILNVDQVDDLDDYDESQSLIEEDEYFYDEFDE